MFKIKKSNIKKYKFFQINNINKNLIKIHLNKENIKNFIQKISFSKKNFYLNLTHNALHIKNIDVKNYQTYLCVQKQKIKFFRVFNINKNQIFLLIDELNSKLIKYFKINIFMMYFLTQFYLYLSKIVILKYKVLEFFEKTKEALSQQNLNKFLILKVILFFQENLNQNFLSKHKGKI